MRSVVFRYDDLHQFAAALDRARGQALSLPEGMLVRDGEWVLAMFELGGTRRATAAAGRGALLDDGPALVFERRDWERLRQFSSVSANPESSARIAAAPPFPPQELSGEHPVPDDVRRSGVHGRPEKPVDLRRTAAWEHQQPMPIDFPADTDQQPIAPHHEVEERADPTVRQRLSGQGSTVLLVDDDADLREVVGAMLEAVGLVVELVGTAEEAFDIATQRPPNLIVLDWSLPGMSGIDLCRALRKRNDLGNLPVLFLTAHSGTQDMVEAFAAGADDYVVKPFRAAELGARIFGLLRRARQSTTTRDAR